MKIAIRENYIDTTALTRFSEEELSQAPYNFKFVEIPNDKQDCVFEDFDFNSGEYSFNLGKYNTRKQVNSNQARITELKANLTATDYQAIKFAEGELTESEFAPIREQRREWREEINELEG